MNRQNKLIIDLLKAESQKYRETVSQICDHFRTQRDHAKAYASKFKSEDEIYRDNLKAIIKESRESLHAAQAELSEVYNQQAGKLEDSVQESLMHALNVAFVQRLEFYRNTGLKPTRSEVETLIALADNHLTALAGVNRILEANGSDFRVKHTTAKDLEKDLVTLRNFAMLIPCATNTEQAQILSEILGDNGKRTIAMPNQPNALGYTKPGESLNSVIIEAGEHVKRLVNGRIFDGGDVYNFSILNAEAVMFEKMEKELSEMQVRWSGVTTPDIETVSETVAKESGDDEIIESGIQIVAAEDKATKLARELGEEASRWHESILDDYSK